VPLITLAPGGTVDRDLAISEPARARIAVALAAGYVVVVPERAIDLGGGPITGWWQIDPVTGAAFDRLETGQGAAILFSPMGEEMVILYRGVHGVVAIRRMTLCCVGIYVGAMSLLAGGIVAGIGAGSGNLAVMLGGQAVGVGHGIPTLIVGLTCL